VGDREIATCPSPVVCQEVKLPPTIRNPAAIIICRWACFAGPLGLSSSAQEELSLGYLWYLLSVTLLTLQFIKSR
jgi:hypothetical protein